MNPNGRLSNAPGILTAVLLLLLSVAALVSFGVYAEPVLQVGYVIPTADPGTREPFWAASLTSTNTDGTLVSETVIPETEARLSGMIFVDEVGAHTGLAVVNPNSQLAAVTLILRNDMGVEAGRTSLVLDGRQQLVRYVGELFGERSSGLMGSITFESNQPLVATGLRESRNNHGEPVYTALPFVDTAASPYPYPSVFPQIAVGGGYATRLILINPTDQKIQGQIVFKNPEGDVLRVRARGEMAGQFDYEIVPHGVYSLDMDHPSGLQTGYAVVNRTAESPSPSGVAIFRVMADGQLITETAAAAGGPGYGLYQPHFVDFVNARTAVAVANINEAPTIVTFSLFDPSGQSEGLTTRTIRARGQLTAFVDELFPNLMNGFTGYIDIIGAGTAPLMLKVAVNARSDLVLTAFPMATFPGYRLRLNPLVIPFVAFGNGFSTRLISEKELTQEKGKLTFYQSSGTPMIVSMGNGTGSQLSYRLVGSRQYIGLDEPEIISVTPVRISTKGGENVTIEGDHFLPETIVTIGNVSVPTVNVLSSRKIMFTAPPITSGMTTLTVQNQGGLAQAAMSVAPVSLGELPAGYITTIAGGSTYAGDGSQSTSASLSSPYRVAVDSGGDLYIADTANHRIRRVNRATGIITTVAGSGHAAYSGDGGPATAAALHSPRGLAIDGTGNLYIADTENNRIRKVDHATGRITTVAGTGGAGSVDDGVPATAAAIAGPHDVVVDASGNLYFGANCGQIRKVDQTTGLIRTLGNFGGYCAIFAIAADGKGNLFVANTLANMILRVDARTGASSDVAGIRQGPCEDISNPLLFSCPDGIAVDASGNLFIADTGHQLIRRIDAGTGAISTVGSEFCDSDYSDYFSGPTGLAVDTAGNLFVVCSGDPHIREIVGATGRITTINQNHPAYLGDDGPATEAAMRPGVITFDPAGNLLFAETLSSRIRKIEKATGIIRTVAGNGKSSFSGDNGPAAAASLGRVTGIAADASGNIFLSDSSARRIRKVDRETGFVTTIAGNGEYGFSGDDGPATSAALGYPGDIAIDGIGNLFIQDRYYDRIRKVDRKTGVITTIATTGYVIGMAFDAAGNLVILSYESPTILPGAGVPIVAPRLPPSLFGNFALDLAGNLFVRGGYPQTQIRKFVPTTGETTIVAGNGQSGFSGDNGPATAAALGSGLIAFDPEGNLYIAESETGRIRAVRGPIR